MVTLSLRAERHVTTEPPFAGNKATPDPPFVLTVVGNRTLSDSFSSSACPDLYDFLEEYPSYNSGEIRAYHRVFIHRHLQPAYQEPGEVWTKIIAGTWTKPNIPSRWYPLLNSEELNIEARAQRLLMVTPISQLSSMIWEIIQAERQQGLPLQSATLTTFSEPEDENGEEIAFRLILNCGAKEALGAWDRLSDRISELGEELTPPERRILYQTFRIDVDWLG